MSDCINCNLYGEGPDMPDGMRYQEAFTKMMTSDNTRYLMIKPARYDGMRIIPNNYYDTSRIYASSAGLELVLASYN